MKRLILLLLFLGTLPFAHAQDDVQTSVYITTQDNINLREGPGINWDIIETLPPSLTLPAVGRTANSAWVQVVYEGQYGWLAANYLVWSGDLIDLPVDGVEGEPYVRQRGVAAITVRDTPIYTREVDPANQVEVLRAGTEVEVVGRLGYESDTFFNVQILYNGELYWAGAWNLNLFDGRYTAVLDISYRFAYSRLVRQFFRDINGGENALSRIENIWLDLQAGLPVSCDRAPELLGERRVSDGDLSSEPTFTPAAIALDSALGSTNTAIALFVDACTRDDVFLTQRDVQTALSEVDNARRNYNIARSLLLSLERRDPILGDVEEE